MPARFRSKSHEYNAMTFTELVDHGRKEYLVTGKELIDGMPWSFTFMGQPVSHENEKCYLVNTPNGTKHVTPDTLLFYNGNMMFPVPHSMLDVLYDPVPAEKAPRGDIRHTPPPGE